MTKTKTPRKKKEKISPEPHWRMAYAVALSFMVAKFGEAAAVLTESQPRDLKLILKCLRENAEVKGEWTQEVAAKTLGYFLEYAFLTNLPELPYPKTRKWFLAYTAKYQPQIIEQIKLYKQSTAKA